MAAPVKKELQIEGLDCANCAMKIEKAVQGIAGVRQASVNFAAKRLTFEIADSASSEQIIAQVIRAAIQTESGIQLFEKSHKSESGGTAIISRVQILRLVSGSLLFVLALFFQWDVRLELLIFILSYLLIGGSVLIRAAKNIIHGQVFDEHFLMSLATLGALAIREYPEAIAVMLFYEIGEIFESLAVGHSRRSISALMDIRPDYANLKKNGEISKVPPDQVQEGDWIVVKPGEKVPLDGIISEGSTLLDTSAITGESLPREVSAGDAVYSGSINKNGLFTLQVTKVFSESTVSRILDLVQNAGSKKAPTEKFITRFAQYYTPAVVFIAILLAVIPPLVIPGAAFTVWFYRALAFLVVSCPCALVISIPLGYFGGIGAASKNGILIKGSNYLEALARTDTVVFDKTGTLTQGKFQISEVHSFTENGATDELLRYAAFAEFYSIHPIARSIVDAYGADRIVQDQILSFDEKPGHGIQAKTADHVLLAGNSQFFAAEGIATVTDDRDVPGSIVHLAVDGKYAGHILITDTIKPDARQAIQQLKSIGISHIAMLTGDNKEAAGRIGQSLGIDDVYSELLPSQKVEQFERIAGGTAHQGKTIFVGDGINDAPVLARADVGISMGALGSDAAIEAADVVIMTDHPSKVPAAILIARKTRRIVWQNIGMAFFVKSVVLALSAIGMTSLWGAVFADIGVALIAIFNSVRVLRTGKQEVAYEHANLSNNTNGKAS